ncbi:hypothetical protein PROFUN_00034 [Planoprotostelium fungivorum]|uniref:Phosphatidic acid phosphatase type 2/haloperoxidase domain-containing protein n=1 Tax=Planoprotostelium fungivorum TaxID=1890364 RepID=A0A2P6P0G3_9EUKA|nr:hypothetical protein PROFUN_00034 [Planoprotostelium fungivorum]
MKKAVSSNLEEKPALTLRKKLYRREKKISVLGDASPDSVQVKPRKKGTDSTKNEKGSKAAHKKTSGTKDAVQRDVSSGTKWIEGRPQNRRQLDSEEDTHLQKLEHQETGSSKRLRRGKSDTDSSDADYWTFHGGDDQIDKAYETSLMEIGNPGKGKSRALQETGKAYGLIPDVFITRKSPVASSLSSVSPSRPGSAPTSGELKIIMGSRMWHQLVLEQLAEAEGIELEDTRVVACIDSCHSSSTGQFSKLFADGRHTIASLAGYRHFSRELTGYNYDQVQLYRLRLPSLRLVPELNHLTDIDYNSWAYLGSGGETDQEAATHSRSSLTSSEAISISVHETTSGPRRTTISQEALLYCIPCTRWYGGSSSDNAPWEVVSRNIRIQNFVVSEVTSLQMPSPICNDTLNGSYLFNGCHIDSTKYLIPSAISFQILQWFTFPTVMILCVSLLFVVVGARPSLDIEGDSSEVNAKVDSIRLQTVFLLFRMALVYSLTWWLKMVISQKRPCDCLAEYPYDNERYPTYGLHYVGEGPWGMPSSLVSISAVVGLFLSHKINLFAGIALPLLVAAAKLTLGYNSLGQVLAAIALGIVIHLYSMFTPSIFRALDFSANLIGGLIAFFVTRHQRPQEDYGYINYFFHGVAWQVFVVLVLFTMFDWSFVKSILMKPAHNMNISDFQYYMPLNEMSQRKRSGRMVSLYIVGLFLVLIGITLGIDIWTYGIEHDHMIAVMSWLPKGALANLPSMFSKIRQRGRDMSEKFIFGRRQVEVQRNMNLFNSVLKRNQQKIYEEAKMMHRMRVEKTDKMVTTTVEKLNEQKKAFEAELERYLLNMEQRLDTVVIESRVRVQKRTKENIAILKAQGDLQSLSFEQLWKCRTPLDLKDQCSARDWSVISGVIEKHNLDDPMLHRLEDEILGLTNIAKQYEEKLAQTGEDIMKHDWLSKHDSRALLDKYIDEMSKKK